MKKQPIDRAADGSFADSAYTRLRTHILDGQLRPGIALKELNLVEELGISRTPIREALRRLQEDGLVSIERGQGARVSEVSLRDAIEMYEIRELVEPYAARIAASQLPPAIAERMQETRRTLIENPPIPEAHVRWQKDRDLHDRILEGAGNALLRATVYNLRVRTERAFVFMTNRRPEVSRQEHLAIIDAILNGDADLAECLMREHIANSKARLVG